MGKFLEHVLLEKEEIKSSSNTDPHELMTAFFCSLDDGKFKLLNPDGKKAEDADAILQTIYDEVSNVKTSKIVGQNEKEIASVISFKDKYDALAAAYSAAKEIRKNFDKKVKFVILTGRKWTSDVEMYSGIENLKAFGIDSYGMKDFNSSDIILTDKSTVDRGLIEDATKTSKFLGVSLKKVKSNLKAEEPTRLNRSVEDALGVNEKVKKEIQDAFNDFYNTTIKQNIDKLLPKGHPYKKMFDNLAGRKKTPFKDMSSGEEVEAWFRKNVKNLQNDDWKVYMSSKVGLMSAHPCKDNVRNVINEALKRKGSVFEKLQSVIMENSNDLAYALIKTIYKGSLKNLIAYNFDFGFCIGKGGFVNKKCKVVDGTYEPITIIENVIEKLRRSGKPNMTISKKQKPFDENQTTAKLFFDLNIDEHPLANIEVRYKGDFGASPQFFATMAPEFKTFLEKGRW